ncbi:zinc-binding alcohol dehydrogenase family protein [Microbulbifer yueqingensis]|uniref:Zinc-type alcohol dehydrogenase-like protein n=1 Tax=Microbulbifer yueqingensis TaxID=658219 RepID=A0A1G8XJU4_9GAMM|nr:zinc-binding alcohol dehydrogenase family protein [Microbulbifer yueqingensis]SDJ90851.1 zinc-binding alcohol dehydrogenase family protein [Microbulbifer yueqingensis]
MKAIGLYQYLPVENEKSLVDVYLDRPRPGPRDILVAVQAIAVNPVDTKVRAPREGAEKPSETPQVLGWDAAGEVIDTGEEVENFRPGDRVYYAGDITRPGCYSEMHLVDERLAGHLPESLDFTSAAALPLTGLTAWEALFERLGISTTGEDAGKSILVIGGAGGVGSMAVQLARHVARLKVLASASRTKSSVWTKKLGAHHIVNHRHPLDRELQEHGFDTVDYILCLNDTDQHWNAMANAIAPQGRICGIVDNRDPLPLNLLKSKSATFAWEFMFTRSRYRTPDMQRQGEILNEIARLVDEGVLKSTVNQVLEPINAANLRQAHALIESGHTIGKIVLAGW